jgi:hypothetical protein
MLDGCRGLRLCSAISARERDAFPELIEITRPRVYYCDKFEPIFGAVRVRSSNSVRLLVGELAFDGVQVPSDPFRESGSLAGVELADQLSTFVRYFKNP